MNSNTGNDILHRAQEIFEDLVNIRRELHQIPEPGFEETKTSRFIAGILQKWNIALRQGVAKTGIIASIESNPAKKTVALRADMDALPVDEKNDLPFRSKHNGYFHACGHDMHMTCLLGALAILNERKNDLPVNVRAIFQPAEEKIPGGALAVIKDKGLENPDVEAIFGLHVEPFLPTGCIAVKPGPMMAATAQFTIRVIGKGGHAAKPFKCNDPIPIAAQIVTSLQTITSPEYSGMDPLKQGVITVTKINAGTAYNVIPEEATLQGSARALDEYTAKVFPEKIENIVKDIVSVCGADYTFEYNRGTTVLINDEKMTKHVRDVGKKLLDSGAVRDYDGTLGGEDFAEYLSRVPGCFFRLGCAPRGFGGEPVSLHHPKFNPDEQVLIYGSAMLAGIVMEFGKTHEPYKTAETQR